MSRKKQYGLPLSALFTLSLFAACDNTGENTENTDNTPKETVQPTKLIPYTIVKEYPHDPTAFTEGLEYVDGKLYESVGQYGKSDIRIADLETGKVLKQQKMDARYFGEGMTVLGNKVYQLTYQEKTGFIYDKQTLKPLGTFAFDAKEGWGMTNDGTHLIYGDGQTSLIFLDANTLKEVKRLTVSDQYGPVVGVNELEYINGFIYGNQWQTNLILKIDPQTGKVVANANLNDLRHKINVPEPVPGDETAPEVLNGIAYDATGNRVFITGKNWPKIIEIKLDN